MYPMAQELSILQINWTKVAEATNLKNAKVAATRYSQIVKKHGLSSAGATSASPTPSTSATKGTKRKATTTAGSGTKRGRKLVSLAAKDDEEEVVGDENHCVKVKTEDDSEAKTTMEEELEHELEQENTVLDT